MELTPNGEIAVSAYVVTELTAPSIDSEGFLVINMNEQGVYNSSYADAGIFLEAFDSDESGIEDLSYNNGDLFGGGYLSKMVPGNVFDFTFVKLIYNPNLSNVEINSPRFTVYPNPVNDVLKIKLDKTGSYSINLLDLTGKAIAKCELIANSLEMNVSEIPSGIYFISMSNLTTGITETKKVIVE